MDTSSQSTTLPSMPSIPSKSQANEDPLYLKLRVIEVDSSYTLISFKHTTTPSLDAESGQRIDVLRNGSIRRDSKEEIDYDIGLSVSMPEETDAAFIVFSWEAGHRRYRLPNRHKIVFEKHGSATVQNSAGSRDIGFNWRGHVYRERARSSFCSLGPDNLGNAGQTAQNAWEKYTADYGEIWWPVVDQPTALDLESLRDVLTYTAIRQFLIDYAPSSLQGVDRRVRVRNELMRWRWENVQGKTRDLDEQQRQVVREGVSIVTKALKNLLDKLERKAQDT
ncbi:hypothetical protein PENSPDRAFT_752806 [Peniophora sp. CONT]|nr:hypothetical protein PENSPDRAFT_752806 [Peniophora sp. CONT]